MDLLIGRVKLFPSFHIENSKGTGADPRLNHGWNGKGRGRRGKGRVSLWHWNPMGFCKLDQFSFIPNKLNLFEFRDEEIGMFRNLRSILGNQEKGLLFHRKEAVIVMLFDFP
jgi:hypothetical protein